jgi:SAM-dependent methyltransferase
MSESRIDNKHLLFKERGFSEACKSVIDTCNNIPFQERWDKETPLFAKAILRNFTRQENRILDYGTGVGRLAKAILELDDAVEILGVDDSPVQLGHAARYVDNPRFSALLPQESQKRIDMAYCVYVLQHIPAIALRDALTRMHYWLRPGGTLVVCTAYARMAPRYDARCTFFDDRLLGVNIRAEIERLFEPQGDLFTAEELQEHEILRRMILGDDGRKVPTVNGARGTDHPAIVYQRREISVPYFDVPMPSWYIGRE